MEIYNGIKTTTAQNPEEWRSWLAQNHSTEKNVWLIIYRKDSPTPSITYPEAVDEALCFGWIDSKPNKRDGESYYQFFSKRNPKSKWSRVNKDKIVYLTEQKRMAPAGIAMVNLAKQNGAWEALDDVENLTIPDDLAITFAKYPNAAQNFDAFPKSVKKGILEWVLNARTPETRTKRMEDTATKAAVNERANQYVKK